LHAQEQPVLLAQQLTVFERVHRVLVEAVAERTGTDANANLSATNGPVAAIAVKAAMDLWDKTDGSVSVADMAGRRPRPGCAPAYLSPKYAPSRPRCAGALT